MVTSISKIITFFTILPHISLLSKSSIFATGSLPQQEPLRDEASKYEQLFKQAQETQGPSIHNRQHKLADLARLARDEIRGQFEREPTMDSNDYFSAQRLMASKIPDTSVAEKVNHAIDVEEKDYSRQPLISFTVI